MKKLVLFVAVFLLLAPALSHAATLNFGGASQYAEGDTVTVPVLLTTAEAANAASAAISYDKNILNLVSISKAGSIISLWPEEPSYNSAAGSAQFEGVILNPGWSGSGGTVVTLTFVAKAPGSALLSFSNASVLANDGNGTEILTAAPSKTISVSVAATPETPKPATATVPAAPKITSSTHPNQSTPYSDTKVTLAWNAIPGTSWVRIGYDRDPQGAPTVLYNPPIYTKQIELPDGVWYFHVQERGSGGWGPTATYKITIDTNAPAPAPTPEAPIAPATAEPEVTPPPAEGGFPITPLSISLIITVIALLLLAAADLARRAGAGRKTGKKGWTAAEAVLHKQFSDLKEAISHELLALEHAKTRRALTDEEDRFAERMKKMLDRAEHAIEQEL